MKGFSTMTRFSIALARILPMAVVGIGVLSWSPLAHADLHSYVAKADESFAWKLEHNTTSEAGTVYELSLVSQKWHDITWKHQLVVYQPKGIASTKTMLLMNTGGSAGLRSNLLGMELARKCNAPVAILFHVPNQPLLDGKKEDALIAETFVRYLKTKDATWPLLFPMVKSVVRAMDALQKFTKEQWKEPVEQFVITGGSKRGWTSWLTAASGDKRVKAIAPMVIDVLNMQAQMKHQKESLGQVSHMIHDYTERGLIDGMESEAAQELFRLVDPYSYRKELTQPKLILLGNNDPYWTTDALNLYWEGLPGSKWVTYVPNAGHDLQQKDAEGRPNLTRVSQTLAAFTRAMIADKTLPTLQWNHDDAEGQMRLTVEGSTPPKEARLWIAQAPTRDFRQARWEERKADVEGKKVVALLAPPEKGCLAFYAELEYEMDGMPYYLSTQLRIAGTPEKK